jgi:acetyl esterase/lipase
VSHALRWVALWATLAPCSLLAGPPGPAESGQVKEHSNLAYRDREPGEILPGANLLDLYLPARGKGFPVVVLVHGGAWMWGDKNLDFIPSVARRLARCGIVVAAPNYRLAPLARYPAHIQDVARAVAWVHKHVGEYGGDAGNLFLMGHSAGGHLVSLLAADVRLLKPAGFDAKAIRGVISVSGIYQLSEVTLQALARTPRKELEVSADGNPYALVFGNDPDTCRQASPMTHVRRGLPPFLIVVAENDLPTLAEMALQFDAALREHGCQGRLLKAADRNHVTVLWSARHPDDPLPRAVVEFVRKYTTARER